MTKEQREALESAAAAISGLGGFGPECKVIRAMLEADAPKVEHADAIRRLKAVEAEIERGEHSISRGMDGLTPRQARKSWADELAGVIRMLEEGTK